MKYAAHGSLFEKSKLLAKISIINYDNIYTYALAVLHFGITPFHPHMRQVLNNMYFYGMDS